MISSVRVLIYGRVQGVGYRAWAVATAGHMGLRGWVRNRSDGTVESVFIGEEEIVIRMIEACKKGPMMAQVDRIESFAWKEEVADSLFSARPTV